MDNQDPVKRDYMESAAAFSEELRNSRFRFATGLTAAIVLVCTGMTGPVIWLASNFSFWRAAAVLALTAASLYATLMILRSVSADIVDMVEAERAAVAKFIGTWWIAGTHAGPVGRAVRVTDGGLTLRLSFDDGTPPKNYSLAELDGTWPGSAHDAVVGPRPVIH